MVTPMILMSVSQIRAILTAKRNKPMITKQNTKTAKPKIILKAVSIFIIIPCFFCLGRGIREKN
jgi:hypothetical protein